MSRGVDQLSVARMMGVLGLVCVSSWVAMLQMQLSDPTYGGEAVNIDFAIYWAAAKLTLAEGPLAPFDLASLNAARGLPQSRRGAFCGFLDLTAANGYPCAPVKLEPQGG